MAGLAALLALAGCGDEEGETRPPKPEERAYTGFALDIESHEPCLKISPRALVKAAGNSPGTRIYYQRSACFFYLATRTRNDYFCGEVKEAKSSLLSGKFFSAANCRAWIASGRMMRAHLGFDHEVVLRALGYDDAAVQARFATHPDPPAWLDFYYQVVRKGSSAELMRRLKAAPDFSGE